MVLASAGHDRNDGPRRPAARQWAIWSLPRRASAFALAVDAVAATLTTTALAEATPTRSDLGRVALLAGLSAIHGEVEDRTDRFRRSRSAARLHVDGRSVWTFAGVLLLPVGYAALLVAIVYAHTLVRERRHRSWPPHRTVFTGAAVALSALAASPVNDGLGHSSHVPHEAAQLLGLLGALIVYRVVDDVAVTVFICLASDPGSIRHVLFDRDELAVEIATMILGAFTAQTVIQMPWLTPAVLILIVVMYRGVLTRQLEVKATRDGKTGLLNATAWREVAQRHLWRAVREDQAAAVLVIDLDRFKALNDQHGHLVGDAALKAVADCLRHELRGYDAVGRYGGEEFVALLPNAGANAAMRVAERLREGVEACAAGVADHIPVRLTASIGVSTYPTHGGELDDLIHAADTALYAAKDAGRNAVRLAGAVRPASAGPPGPRPARA